MRVRVGTTPEACLEALTEPRQTGLPSISHKDRVKKFKRKLIAHPWQVVSVRNIKSLSY
ncbi:hypothetical protein BDI4_1070015 [Burkholderia diffusa]|nr:hypothetical protein BDI4_1070015 [Burkholderia diffusa]